VCLFDCRYYATRELRSSRYHENTEDLVQAAYEGESKRGFCGVQKSAVITGLTNVIVDGEG
jgi:hypothetical protein